MPTAKDILKKVIPSENGSGLVKIPGSGVSQKKKKLRFSQRIFHKIFETNLPNEIK